MSAKRKYQQLSNISENRKYHHGNNQYVAGGISVTSGGSSSVSAWRSVM